MANISRCSVSGRFFQKIAKLGSRSREQQQGPLKGPGVLLGSFAGTAVHRGWPAGQISYPCHGGYTTAGYVFSTYHVCVRVGTALQAMELCLRGPVAGVDVSAGWAGLARVLGWYSHELSFIPVGLVLDLLADGSPALGQNRPVEAALLRYVSAGVLQRTCGGARHVADCRVLNGNQPVFADDVGRDSVFCSLQVLDALTLYCLELHDVQVVSTCSAVPSETAFGGSVSLFDVHPTGSAVTYGGVSAALHLALKATDRLPVLAGVNAGNLLVIDDGKPLHHAWVNPAGLVLCRRRLVIWELVHQRGCQRPAVLGDPDGSWLFQNIDAVGGLETQDGQALDVDLGDTRFPELDVLYSRLGYFQCPELVREPRFWKSGAGYGVGPVVGVVDSFDDRFGQFSGDVREVWVVLAQVGNAGVLEMQYFLVGNTSFAQHPAVSDGCVLEFAQQWQQSFHFLVSLLAGPYWVLELNGVQLRLLAHPLILSSGKFRNFLRWSGPVRPTARSDPCEFAAVPRP